MSRSQGAVPAERWFDRVFELGLPLTRLAGIVERLRGTPLRLESRVRALPRDVRTRRVNETWSIQENAGHLLDLEPLWLTRTHELIEGRSDLAPADLTNRRTHEAAHNARPLGDILRAFAEQRALLVRAMEEADATAQTREAIHPRLRQPMRMVDLAFFVAEHDDHHLARITELLRTQPA